METDTEDGAEAGGSPRIRVRTRRPADLPQCALALAEVHRQDGYPVNWPEDAAGWLGRVSEYGAWVAVLDGRTVGHIGLGVADADLAAADGGPLGGPRRQSAAARNRASPGPSRRASPTAPYRPPGSVRRESGRG
ncbi:hypothetical protein JGS22_017825 [Streptomyces sp. P38-E01]|uniref:GNAT family N-acetyltransferase n=1 Tax=Streptomyces tardus TaxID=2780544 RepID=A0A949JNI0_9ACTN|nr:hypothetical protein [Streptomyces tardus]MBU7599424.1 hypothetical protein [Streptomyces tardus]